MIGVTQEEYKAIDAQPNSIEPVRDMINQLLDVVSVGLHAAIRGNGQSTEYVKLMHGI